MGKVADTASEQILSKLKKAAKELRRVLKYGGVKSKVTPSLPAEQEEDGAEQETEEACSLQETLLPDPDIRPGPTPCNSRSVSIEDIIPNHRPEVTKIPDRPAEDIAHAKEAARETESFLKTFPPICVDKTKRTKGQKPR